MERQRRHKRKLLHVSIGAHDNRSHEITSTIAPNSPAAAAPGGLAIGDHPMAIRQANRTIEQPVIGRTHFGEVGKGRRGQPGTVNKAAAARPVAATSGVMASMPSGEQNSAAAAIIAPLVTLPVLAAGTPGSSKNITLMRRR